MTASPALNLADRIRRLADGRPTLDVAQFQFIGLRDIRARYGDAWTEKRDRVQAIAGDFISKRIWPEDVLVAGADGFLVVFGQRSGLIADAASQRISKALNDFFIGLGPDDVDVQFEARRKAMAVEDITGVLDDLSFLDDETDPADLRYNIPTGPLPAQLMQMRFQPIWDARREALTNFLVTPVDPRTAERVAGYHFEPHADAVRSYLELDELQLKASEEALQNLFSAGRKALISVSVHVSSLQTTAALSQIFSVLSGFDRKLAAYRVLRIVGIEPGFPRIYLEDICRTLMTRVQRMAFGIAWNEPDIPSLLRLRPSAVGFLLPPAATSPWSSRADLIGRVRSAIEVCTPHHVPFFVDGNINPDLARAIVAERASFLASPRIWPLTAKVPGAGKWFASRLNDRPLQDSAA
ncbi:MAG: hypothetical protein GC155_16245 [Alphaproteobacteria bacterium]|nr:hypothetical protein [Alphaproteobacteria bacterium]